MSINPILKQVLINGLITQSAARGVKRGSTWLGYIVLAGGIALIGIVYFSIAGYGLLMQSFTAPAAASMVGGILFALSAIVALIGYYTVKRKAAHKVMPKPEGFMDSVENTLQGLMGGLEEPIRDNPKLAMLMAALAGFAAGDKLGDHLN